MAKLGGKKAWVAAGVALLLAFAIVPALSGAASAASVTSPALVNPANQWAYGGEGWSNNSLVIGNATIHWDSMFGWTVIFTVTQTAPGIWMIEEQRTLGITISTSASSPHGVGTYYYHAQETDVAFANVTNHSVVYVGGQAVPALGILNASASVNGLIDQSISVTVGGLTRSASLDVTGTAHAFTSFAPSLGLIPLNLSGIHEWNSTAVASPSASWNVSWTWKDQGYNGTTGSGSGSKTGNLSGTGIVRLTGFQVAVLHPFSDHMVRVGLVLIIQGPFDDYDAFILVPHDFDLFGSAVHDYDSLQLGSAGISAENLYVSSGPGGPTVTAADQTFGSADTAINAQASPMTDVAPAASSSPATTVNGQPISLAQAQVINHGLTSGPSSSGGSMANGVLVAALIGLVVVAVVGTLGVIEWRSYSRRRSKGGLVGGYGESWPNGVPPAAALPPNVSGPTAPQSGPGTLEDPSRRL